MSASAKPLPKKDLLEKLTVDELREGIERCGISVRDHRKKGLVKSLSAPGGRGVLQEILSGLPRDRLKVLCRAFDVDDRGRTKADLAARLVGQPVLSVKQPLAWAIISGLKDIENRKWSTEFRGQLWIHASKAPDDEEDEYIDKMCRRAAEKGGDPAGIRAQYERERALGKVLGSVELVKVVTESDSPESPWFGGPYGFVLRKPVPLPEPIDLRGTLSIFYAAGLPPLP